MPLWVGGSKGKQNLEDMSALGMGVEHGVLAPSRIGHSSRARFGGVRG